MAIIRSVKPYHHIYKILEDLQVVASPARIKDYEEIDWTIIAGHTTLLRMDLLIQEMDKEEYVCVVDQKSDMLSKSRISDLGLVFWTLAKIQSDQDIIEEITR